MEMFEDMFARVSMDLAKLEHTLLIALVQCRKHHAAEQEVSPPRRGGRGGRDYTKAPYIPPWVFDLGGLLGGPMGPGDQEWPPRDSGGGGGGFGLPPDSSGGFDFGEPSTIQEPGGDWWYGSANPFNMDYFGSQGYDFWNPSTPFGNQYFGDQGYDYWSPTTPFRNQYFGDQGAGGWNPSYTPGNYADPEQWWNQFASDWGWMGRAGA